jgi:hypothetical protein
MECGDFRVDEFAGSPVLSDPFGGELGLAIRRRYVDIPTEPNDVFKPKGCQKLEQLRVAESSISEDRDDDTFG